MNCIKRIALTFAIVCVLCSPTLAGDILNPSVTLEDQNSATGDILNPSFTLEATGDLITTTIAQGLGLLA